MAIAINKRLVSNIRINNRSVTRVLFNTRIIWEQGTPIIPSDAVSCFGHTWSDTVSWNDSVKWID